MEDSLFIGAYRQPAMVILVKYSGRANFDETSAVPPDWSLLQSSRICQELPILSGLLQVCPR